MGLGHERRCDLARPINGGTVSGRFDGDESSWVIATDNDLLGEDLNAACDGCSCSRAWIRRSGTCAQNRCQAKNAT